jgi:malate synthase
VQIVSDASATGGLQVDPALRDFVADELLAGLDLEPTWFWSTLAELNERFAGRVGQLLRRRDELQQQIDDWHREHRAGDVEALEAFLTDIGYLLPLEDPTVRVTGVDREIAEVPGPQLVVPATVPRYALNAANARWGSLFDALYGTDALPSDHEPAPGYDERRGAQVIAEADRLLDRFFPLAGGSHADVVAYRVPSPGELAVETSAGRTGLADPAQFAGHRPGDGDRPAAVLLRRNGLHLELTIDPSTRVGAQHHAGVSDAVLESAVSTIVDLEDSVATVDGPDKVGAYRTWLGLRTGELTATFGKGGRP